MSQQYPLSAPLARRLAEAADGLRDDKFYYFVSKRVFPFDLLPVKGDSDTVASELADAMVEDLNFEKNQVLFEKFGPYKTDKDYEQPFEYDQIEINFLQGNEVMYSQYLDAETDAIILSLSAFDKFFLPYYSRLYGPDVAQDMRIRAINVLSADPRSQNEVEGMPRGTPKMIIIRKSHTLTLGI